MTYRPHRRSGRRHVRRVVSVLTATLGLSALLVGPNVPAAATTAKAGGASTAGTERAPRRIGSGRLRAKAPKVTPSRPRKLESASPASQSQLLAGPPGTSSLATQTLTANATVADTTAPVAPQVMAQAPSSSTISAQWTGAQDPESGISYYVFGIGTNSSGSATDLANVRWWQVSYQTSMSVNLTLDAGTTYYVSVQAVNGVGVYSALATSNGVRPTPTQLGQPGNVMQLRLTAPGIDAAGNPTTGWTDAQVATMTAFFNRMYPILEQLYGPPADSYTVTAVRDLRYTGSNVFFPSTDEIHMSDGFYPQLFTHELVHAFRNDHLLSSDQNWEFDNTLSPFEEAFAQAVSYEAMNKYVEAYPSDTIVPGTSLWGSSNDWDYDFQNVPELRGTDFWSEGGGTGLYWLKYEMGAAALRKIELESPGFYKRFNQEYYRRINANPATVRSSRALIVDIIQTLVPQIEGIPAADWVNRQSIFYAQNVYGEKIFHRIQDYPWNELFAFQDLFFMDTMSCGSEWACWDGTQWNYHHLNGSQGTGRLVDADGNAVWSGNLLIQPTQNPSDGNYAFGYARKGLTTASTLQPWPGGSVDDYVMNLKTLGLYRFESTFVDAATQIPTTNSVYRVMGSPIANNFQGVWGGVLGHKNGTIYLNHEGFAPEAGIAVTRGAFQGTRSWAGVANARTGGRDSVPGRVFATFVDSDTGATYSAQRNIDYGSVNGNQMFLFDFTGASTTDPTAPTVALTAPGAGAAVSGSVPVTASASSPSGITKVEFYLDNSVLIGSSTSSPYTVTWSTSGLVQGSSHTLTARAFGGNGEVSSSAPRTVTIRDTTAPTVSLTSPASGATVSNTVTISASASDNVGVTRVEMLVDGNLVATDATAPYSATWNPAAVTLGSHSITARAYDQAGNSASSPARSVTVTDTTVPTVVVTKPANGSTVNRSSTVTITATAADNRAVARVQFYVNNVLRCTDTTSAYSCNWSVPSARNVRYTIRVRATDTTGNFAEMTSTVTSR